MTLNLMLTSRSAVYLTGDFRLTYNPGGRTQDDLNVQKLVPIFRFGWTALVSFTGVAKTDRGLDVGDWISAKLSEIPKDAKFRELPKTLLTADRWLHKISGYRNVAFSIVGFMQRRPVAMVISNFLDMDGSAYATLPKLRLFEIRPKIPEVRVMGDARDINSGQLSALKQLMVQNKTPRQIHLALGEVNETAAKARPQSTISVQCVTGHLLPTGAGEITPHGIDDRVEYMPNFVMRDFQANGVRGFKMKVDEDGQPLPPRWVGMTMKVRQNAIVNIHAIRNVKEAVGGGPKDSQRTAFWKIAKANEGPVKISFNPSNKNKLND
jgi:hypothetical protein